MAEQDSELTEIGARFIKQAREFLTKEYLPKIERCLERLSDEQLWWRANSESNSIGNLVLHLSGNARQWIVCGLGGVADKRERQAEFDERGGLPRKALLTLLRQTVTDVDQTLAGFNPKDLLSAFPIQGTTASGLAAIFHVTEHFSMHTGQIILLTKLQANADLNFYDFSTGKPVHTWHKGTEESL